MNVDSILQEIGAMKTKMNKKEKIVKTPEEAIETIKLNMPTSGYQMLRESLDMAINALKEIQQYRKIGTVEECREAVEKQKAKKIIIRDWHPTRCPTCDHELSTSLGDGYYKHPTFLKRCPECGQAIDWEESEE